MMKQFFRPAQFLSARLLTLILSGLTLLACGGSGGSNNNSGPRPVNTGDAIVRLVNLSPDSLALDLFIRGKKVAEEITYLNKSEYQEIRSGSGDFTVRDTGSFNTIADATRSFTVKEQYSIFVFGPLGDRRVLVVEDDNSKPSNNRVRVRFANSDFNSKGVDVYILENDREIEDSEPAYRNVSKNQLTDYLEADSGQFVIKITEKDKIDVIAESGLIDLEAGAVDTIAYSTGQGVISDPQVVVLQDRE